MAANFDLSQAAVVDCYDEASVWSSIAGSLLLRNIPLRAGSALLDIGCGTGYPLLEIADRLGRTSRAVGVDPWKPALARARRKAAIRGLDHVEVVRANCERMPFEKPTFDLITANLVLNNLKDQSAAIRECARVAKKGAHLAITSNLRGTMQEVDAVAIRTLEGMGLATCASDVTEHSRKRCTIHDIREWLIAAGFDEIRVVERSEELRYASGAAFLQNYFIRLGFLDGWLGGVGDSRRNEFLETFEDNLNRAAAAAGQFRVSIPLAYVEGRRN